MSSFSELKCSICLDVFTDPVSTPCGHNFCKTCLNKCWDNNQTCSCPYCKETFKQRPDLKINTTLREIVDHYKKKSPEKKSLKKHKLMDPVSNLEDYICQKHERPLELFCRDEQTCVCLSCTEGDHKNHNTVPLEEMIQDRIKKIQDIKHSAEVRKVSDNTINNLFIELVEQRNTKKEKAALLEMIELRQKAAEKQDQELIKDLEQEITELKMRNTELEQLSHTEDHLHLLQIYSSLCSPTNTRNWPEISMKTHKNLKTLRRALTQLQETLHEKLAQTGLSNYIFLSCVFTELKWMQQYAVDVSLDPDTAHPNLILSDDGKQVRCGDIWQKLPDNPERFDHGPNVLAKEGFSSGRFYFEVQVKGKTNWTLGVAQESIKRKGEIKLRPSNGFWTVILRNKNEYKACAGPTVSLSVREKPQRIGVFVDYEEGLVSFYDVESSSLIYSYTGQPFTGKLYPYFSPSLNYGGVNSNPLIITPVSYNK
uniref:Uncharacterized protein n=1 Tax=Cyprinus carpio TaxID=7962 RepID=A0A8C1YG78_CYPCA